MRAERSRQAVRHGSGVGAIERVTLRHPCCQPNHWRGLAPYSRSYDALGVNTLRLWGRPCRSDISDIGLFGYLGCH